MPSEIEAESPGQGALLTFYQSNFFQHIIYRMDNIDY